MKLFATLTLLLLLVPAAGSGIGAPELHYGDHTWSFVGFVDEFERYDMRTMVVDLVGVRYIAGGEWRRVWVVAGVELVTFPKQFLSRGPWDLHEEIHSYMEPGDPIMVNIQGNGGEQPNVTKDNIDWSSCQTTDCQFGGYFAESAPLDEIFISGGHAPGWYPWGFLFWQIELIDEAYLRLWRQIE